MNHKHLSNDQLTLCFFVFCIWELHSGKTNIALEHEVFEDVLNMGIFHGYVSLPDGILPSYIGIVISH